MKHNFEFQNLGSMIQIVALTQQAVNWLNDNLQLENWQWFGNAVCIDSRYATDIYEAIENEFD